mgnify:CR=1 FL=1
MESSTPNPVDPRMIPARIGEPERESVVRLLGDHFALDHLTVEEYEFRVQAALGARQWFELAALTTDLPVLDPNRSPVLATGSAQQVSRKANEVWTLMELEPGDRIIAAYPVTRTLAWQGLSGTTPDIPHTSSVGVRFRVDTSAVQWNGGTRDASNCPGVLGEDNSFTTSDSVSSRV